MAPLAALAVLALAGPAAAQTPGRYFEDPQSTNVPYVGWVGDKIRLVKCEAGAVGGTGNWALVDWSGALPDGSETIRPSFLQTANGRQGFAGTGDQAGRTCWEMIVTSMKPGLAQIKLETTPNPATHPSPGTRSVTHDFNVIFLEMNTVTLKELASNEIPGLLVGDPLGDGNFAPIGVPGAHLAGYIRATVTGRFPLGRNFAGDLDAGNQDVDTVVLPNDWETLARQYGVSNLAPVDPRGWDIHDDQSNREGHTPASFCPLLPPKVATRDAVDNCKGGDQFGPFSRLFGGTDPTYGPFDPLRPSSSYLPDGVVDAGDAPMPPLLVAFGISGGFGALAGADKHVIYSRNGTGAATAAFPNNVHNLYAPFSGAYIPATRAPGTASGTTGDLANNFPGFQNFPNSATTGLYHFWDLFNTTSRSGSNNCFDVGGTGQFGRDERIPHPAGFNTASLYTDEHGEGIIRFNPGGGVALVADNQGLCDLGEISSTPRQIAATTITAFGVLPFQQAQRPLAGNSLTKRLFSLAGKSLDCVPKTAIEAFCVETVRDIRGNPVEGALVAFSREPLGKIEAAYLPASTDPAATFQGFDTRGADCSERTLNISAPGSANEILCRTNAKGQAGIVVKSTLPGLVDIDAENFGTRNGGFGVQRVRCIRFAGDGVTLPADANFCSGVPVGSAGSTTTAATTAATTPASTGGITGGGTPTGGTTPPAAAIVSLAGNPIPAAAPAAKAPAAKTAASVRSAKLVVIKGKRYLVVRASGSAATAKVRITLVMRTGKVTKPVLRTIRTNRAVRVPNLLINKHVRTVRVSVVG